VDVSLGGWKGCGLSNHFIHTYRITIY
jgi:hypothetical protein